MKAPMLQRLPHEHDMDGDLLFGILFLVAWFVLQRWLLPRLGVPT